MGRSGIGYSQVANAASALTEGGGTPTVDNVRALLGTGSKSTLTPLLKRWKEQHAETLADVGAGLPATLLQAIKNVYEGMQHEVQLQLNSRQTEHAAQLALVTESHARLAATHDVLQQAHATQSAAMLETRQTLLALQGEHQAEALRTSLLTSENQGLQQRLADRAAQIAGLVHQLEQTRRQFEHYQEASAQQRSEERQAALQLLRDRENVQSGLHRQLAALHATSAQQAERLIAMDATCQALIEDNRSVQVEAAAKQLEHAQLMLRFQETTTIRAARRSGRAALEVLRLPPRRVKR